MVGIHAGVHFLQFPEGLDHEAGTDQKDQGERQFGSDEEGAEAIGGDGSGGASDGGLQRVVQGRGAHVNDGRQAEGDAGGHTDGESEEQHLPIDADFGDAGDAAGIGGDQQAESAEGQQNAEDGAGEGEQDAFDDELLKEASQPGADGSADGDFAAAGFGARQQEVGHIDAGDEENEANRAEEHEHRAAYTSDDLFLEAGDHDGVNLGIEPVGAGAMGVGILLGVARHFRLAPERPRSPV